MKLMKRKKKNKIEIAMRELSGQLSLYHYMPVGTRTMENYFNREDAIDIFKRVYGKEYIELEEKIYLLLDQFEEKEPTSTSNNGMSKNEYLFTLEKVTQIRNNKIIDELPYSELEKIIKEVQLFHNRENGEQLFLYLWIAKFFRPSIFQIFDEFEIDFSIIRHQFIANLLKTKEKDYDLVDRKEFIEVIHPYMSDDIIQYYKEKTLGECESAHMVHLIHAIESSMTANTVDDEIGKQIIEALVKDYEYVAIDMDTSNNIILNREIKKLKSKTRYITISLLFIIFSIYAYVYIV